MILKICLLMINNKRKIKMEPYETEETEEIVEEETIEYEED